MFLVEIVLYALLVPASLVIIPVIFLLYCVYLSLVQRAEKRERDEFWRKTWEKAHASWPTKPL